MNDLIVPGTTDTRESMPGVDRLSQAVGRSGPPSPAADGRPSLLIGTADCGPLAGKSRGAMTVMDESERTLTAAERKFARPQPGDPADAQYLENIAQRLLGATDLDYIRAEVFTAYSIGYGAGVAPVFSSGDILPFGAEVYDASVEDRPAERVCGDCLDAECSCSWGGAFLYTCPTCGALPKTWCDRAGEDVDPLSPHEARVDLFVDNGEPEDGAR